MELTEVQRASAMGRHRSKFHSLRSRQRAKGSPGLLRPGLCTSPITGSRLVSRARRASPVEPPDQFAADGLHELLAVHRKAGARSARTFHDQEIILVIGREAIFGSPEETG